MLPVFDGWHNNRAFLGMAPPRSLNRSNAASVGFLSRDLFRLMNEHRAVAVDREGPRHGHIWRKRVDLYSLEDHDGIIEQSFPMKVKVVAIWRT